MAAAGYPVHVTTVALWKRTGWRAPESRHPLDGARAGLDSIAPVVTGNPQTCIDDLIRNHPDRENLEKLPDAELLRLAAREVAMAVVIIARTIQARAVSMSTNAGGVADLLKFGGNRSRCCRQRVRAGADASARRVTRLNASRFAATEWPTRSAPMTSLGSAQGH